MSTTNGAKFGKPLSRRDYFVGCALQACIQKFDVTGDTNDALNERIVNNAVALGNKAADAMAKLDSADDKQPTEPA